MNLHDFYRQYSYTRFKLGVGPTEIHKELEKVYGCDCPGYSSVCRWVKDFKSGSVSFTDKDKSGRPRSSRTENNVQEITEFISENPHYTVRELSRLSGLSYGSVYSILTEDLGKRIVCSKWIPHDLTESQKQQRLSYCKEMLAKFGPEGPNRVQQIFTGDETWILYDEPKRKAQNKAWLSPGETKPTVIKQPWRPKKLMYAIFFRFDGLLDAVPVPRGQTVTAQWYTNDCLPKVFKALQMKRPVKKQSELFILHDNARPHVSSLTTRFLEEKNVRILPHPPYSPDLSPSDFWLFGFLKEKLAGLHFNDDNELHQVVLTTLNNIPKKEWQKTFDKLLERFQLCIDAGGNYFE